MTRNFKAMVFAGAIAMLPLAGPVPVAAMQAAESEAAPAIDNTAIDSTAMTAEATAQMQRQMDEAIALIEKMFDTSGLPPIEPARLAVAQRTTDALIPVGSVEKMLDALYGRMFRTLMSEVGGQSDLMLSIKTGVETDQLAALDDATKNQIADMFDPHRKEREEQIVTIIQPLISEALAAMEPPMRDGLAKAYARKFTAVQLADLNAFLATPTGALYGSEWMALQADPEVMVAVIRAVPPLVTRFIDRAPEIEKDFRELPREKALADLSDAELATLAQLMKVDVDVLEANRVLLSSDGSDASADISDEAMAAAADAAAAEAEAIDDFAYDRTAWSDSDRQRYEEMESSYFELTEKMDALRQEAAANARKQAGSAPTD